MNFKHVPIQTVKRFWNKRPCNIRHSQAKVGSKKYFNEVEKRKYFVEPHILRFANFKRWKNKQVLEIGCGIGTDTINFARAKAQVTAVDLSDESLKIAQKRARVFKLQNRIKFYQANAEKLSQQVPIKAYDLIYSFGVIHHTPHPEKVIDQIKKYCHPKTMVKIMVYYRYSWKVLWILLKMGHGAFWKLDQLVAKHSEAATGSPVSFIYSKAQAKKLLKGFKIKQMQIEHIFPYKIPQYKQYKYQKVWYFRFLPQALFNYLEHKFGWHLCITATV